MEHVYDFYKPLPTSEYPTVDGKLSVSCYLRALDNCFQIYAKKFYAKVGVTFENNTWMENNWFNRRVTNTVWTTQITTSSMLLTTSWFKSLSVAWYARDINLSLQRANMLWQFYNDFLLNKSNLAYKDVQHLADVPTEKSYDNREIEETFVKMSKNAYNTKVLPSTVVPTQIGNTYTASLYFGFASLLATIGSAGLVSLTQPFFLRLRRNEEIFNRERR